MDGTRAARHDGGEEAFGQTYAAGARLGYVYGLFVHDASACRGRERVVVADALGAVMTAVVALRMPAGNADKKLVVERLVQPLPQRIFLAQLLGNVVRVGPRRSGLVAGLGRAWFIDGVARAVGGQQRRGLPAVVPAVRVGGCGEAAKSYVRRRTGRAGGERNLERGGAVAQQPPSAVNAQASE